jgi:hypothetical protein
MRESRTYGSVRGARSNARPYRAPPRATRLFHWHSERGGSPAEGREGGFKHASPLRPLRGHFPHGLCAWVENFAPVGAEKNAAASRAKRLHPEGRVRDDSSVGPL